MCIEIHNQNVSINVAGVSESGRIWMIMMNDDEGEERMKVDHKCDQQRECGAYIGGGACVLAEARSIQR